MELFPCPWPASTQQTRAIHRYLGSCLRAEKLKCASLLIVVTWKIEREAGDWIQKSIVLDK